MIPNTTPTPNELYNGEMKKMNDTELRVVLIVTRATLGWVIDRTTGMRKAEDWISQKQLMEKSGRSNRAISSAIQSCIKEEWIEARDEANNILNTPEERSGKRVFYRLGQIFLKRIASEDSSQVKNTKKPVNITTQTSEHNDTKPVKKVHSTKETITKENIQNTISKDIGKTPSLSDEVQLVYPKRGNNDVNELTDLLKDKFNLKVLDGTIAENRRYCWLAIKKFKRAGVELIIMAGSQDEFWQNQITGFKNLYYKGVQIASAIKKKGRKVSTTF